MRHKGLGFFFAGIALLAGAAAAQAQVIITPIGPTAVNFTDTRSVYTAIVQANANFGVKVDVFLNGVLKGSAHFKVVVNGSTEHTIEHTFHRMNTWGMVPGATLDYRATVTILKGPDKGSSATADWFVRIGPTTTLAPRRVDSQVVSHWALDQDRRRHT